MTWKPNYKYLFFITLFFFVFTPALLFVSMEPYFYDSQKPLSSDQAYNEMIECSRNTLLLEEYAGCITDVAVKYDNEYICFEAFNKDPIENKEVVRSCLQEVVSS